MVHRKNRSCCRSASLCTRGTEFWGEIEVCKVSKLRSDFVCFFFQILICNMGCFYCVIYHVICAARRLGLKCLLSVNMTDVLPGCRTIRHTQNRNYILCACNLGIFVLLYGEYPSESECTDLLSDAQYFTPLGLQYILKYFHFPLN